MEPTLYGTHYSPWTLRARLALVHHGFAHRFREHVPMVGELSLRFAARKWPWQRVTVPLLRLPSGALTDSIEIIRHVDVMGGADSLRSDDPQVMAWIRDLEPAMAAARAGVVQRTLRNPSALREAAAGTIPSFLSALRRPVAAVATVFIARKYGVDATSGQWDVAPMRKALRNMRERIEHGVMVGRRFSAADIVSVALLQAVRPHASLVPLAPGTRAVWECPQLAVEFDDVLQWRDTLVAKRMPEPIPWANGQRYVGNSRRPRAPMAETSAMDAE